jgi:peptide/nickel transport system substrate-binding protein
MSRIGVRARRTAALVSFVIISAFAVALLPANTCAGAGNKALTVGHLSEPPSLNPLLATSNETKDIVWRVFLKLLDEQPNYLDFSPRLARSWEFSPDSLTITFYLRDDVRWTDGAPVTAEDVRFTWELHADTLVAWRSRSLKKYIRDVEVVDRLTVAFHFTQRYPYQLMDANDGVILPKHLLGDVPRDRLRDHPFGRNPVGNGPYMIARWEPEQYIELVRNPDYYEKDVPVVERVVFSFVPDMVTLMTRLKKGEIDLLESIPNDQIPELIENYPDIRIYTYPSREYWYIAWNLRRDMFASAEVRRALSMAINRDEIIETLWGGRAGECKSPIHSTLWAFDQDIEPIPFDPEGARRTLASLGWEDVDGDGILEKGGRAFVFELVTNQSSQRRVDVATMTEAYLRKIGVKASIRTLEFRTVIDKLKSADYDGCVFGWGTATKPDVTSHWHSSAIPPNGYNISYYENPAVDNLIDEAKMALDRDRARELWSQVQRTVYNDQPFTFLLTPYEVNALDKRFCNVEPNAISFFYNLRYWRVGAGCK